MHQIFALFFGKLKTPNSHSEINWPLALDCVWPKKSRAYCFRNENFLINVRKKFWWKMSHWFSIFSSRKHFQAKLIPIFEQNYTFFSLCHGQTSRKSFFLKIPNFWAWADKLGLKSRGILGTLGSNFSTEFW